MFLGGENLRLVLSARFYSLECVVYHEIISVYRTFYTTHRINFGGVLAVGVRPVGAQNPHIGGVGAKELGERGAARG